MDDLSNLDIVVLRAPRDADSLVNELSASNARVHQFPVQKISPLTDHREQISRQIEHIHKFDKAIFVSAYATQYALEWFDRLRPAGNIGVDCFAIGPASAALLEKRKIPISVPLNGWHSEGLLALADMERVRGEKIIIFRGSGGLTLLGDTLRARGASIEYCELYERKIDERFKYKIADLIDSSRTVLLLAHSGEIIDALLAVTDREHTEIIFKTPIVVPGPRLQRHATRSGFNHVIAAASAMAEDMEAAVKGWCIQGL